MSLIESTCVRLESMIHAPEVSFIGEILVVNPFEVPKFSIFVVNLFIRAKQILHLSLSPIIHLYVWYKGGLEVHYKQYTESATFSNTIAPECSSISTQSDAMLRFFSLIFCNEKHGVMIKRLFMLFNVLFSAK